MSHKPGKQKIRVLKGVFAIHRFGRETKMDWASVQPGAFFNITFTDNEISVVTDEKSGIQGSKVEKDWTCFEIQGPLDFGLVGVLHGILDALMKAGVGTFVVSTYDTDYFLVRRAMVQEAIEALKDNGYEIEQQVGG